MKTVTENFSVGLEGNKANVGLELSSYRNAYFCCVSLWDRSDIIGSVFTEIVHGLVVCRQ